MKTILNDDVKWCLRRLPKDVLKLMKSEKDEVMLAGGFIRACIANEKPADVDLLMKTEGKAELYAGKLAENRKLTATENAFTLVGHGIPIQFIHRWTFEKPEDVLPSFDFTIARAMIWYDGDKWRSLCDDRYYADLAAKRLVYCSPTRIEESGGSMLRVLKFYQRGYRIPLDSLGAVIARMITGIDFKKSYDETRLATILTGLLREVDPDIDPTHIAHLPAQDDS